MSRNNTWQQGGGSQLCPPAWAMSPESLLGKQERMGCTASGQQLGGVGSLSSVLTGWEVMEEVSNEFQEGLNF